GPALPAGARGPWSPRRARTASPRHSCGPERCGGEVEPGDRLAVDDLAVADLRERLGERDTRDLRNRLVGLVGGAAVGEPAGQEEVDPLVAEAGRGEDGAEVTEVARHHARLLGTLAGRADLG